MKLRTKKKTFWECLSEHSVSEISFDEEFGQRYSKLYLEWKYFGYLSDALYRFIEKLEEKGYRRVNDHPERCICGTPIKYKFVIINPLTKKYAIIGSCCREKFFAPSPSGKKSALSYVLNDLRCKLEILRSVEDPDLEFIRLRVERLLDVTIHYIEKQTKYKRKLVVTDNFARSVEEFTGIKWKWETWGDYIGGG